MPEEWQLYPGGASHKNREGVNPSDDLFAEADAERRVGRSAEAEGLLRAGLHERPTSEKGVLLLALVLLDQDRGDDTLLAERFS